MLRRLFFILSVLGFVSVGTAQNLIYSEKIEHKTKAELTEKYTLSIFNYDVKHYRILYTTLDVHGRLDTASGLVSIPLGDKKFPLLCYQHGTVGDKTEVPSRLKGGYEISEIWASLGYAVFTPDYLGLGESRGFHPYLHRASEASAALDMMIATKKFLAKKGTLFNKQLFITGYSQGGHAAVAFQKELEENHSDDINIAASVPMSGPLQYVRSYE